MKKKDFLNKLSEILDEETNSLHEETRFNELDSFDSFAVLSIIVFIDEEFENVNINTEKFQELNQIRDLIQIIGKKNIQN